jgi:chromosome partitioning protein
LRPGFKQFKLTYNNELKRSLRFTVSRIIAVANQKGGVGKTTTAINLASGLAVAEKKTLLIDIDPQANSTSGVGLEKAKIDISIYDVLIGRKNVVDVIMPTSLSFLNVVPSSISLVGAEVEMVSMLSRENILDAALSTIVDSYDYIIIDCPPSLGLLTINGLTAAGSVLIPIQCEYYALEGLSQLLHTISMVGCMRRSSIAMSACRRRPVSANRLYCTIFFQPAPKIIWP